MTFPDLILLWAAISQILEIVRLEGQALTHDEGLLPRDIHLLQVIILFVTLYCYEVKTFFHLENQLDMAPNFGEVVTGKLVCFFLMYTCIIGYPW
jgi:hypothetical protein